MSDTVFSHDQKRAILHIMRGKNVFLTGGAGTGKTVVLKEACRCLKEAGKIVLVCAPTGIAAVHAGGTTIHSLFGFPAGSVINHSEKYGYTLMTRVPTLIRHADVIIIDEISMVRCDLFDAIVESILRAEKITGRHIQLIVCGDFYQLPPVVKFTDISESSAFYGRSLTSTDSYAFQGINWNKCHFYPIVMNQCMRQHNEEFIHYLNLLRVGDPSCIAYFNQRYGAGPAKGIKIFATKAAAMSANKLAMDELPGNSCVIKRKIVYEYGFSEADLEKTDLDELPPDLTLKTGVKVIMTANNVYGNRDEVVETSPSFRRYSADQPIYVNGTTGTILDVGAADEHGGVESLVVAIDGGDMVICDRIAYPVYAYRIDDSGTKIDRILIAKCWQYPVLPAYAITIHRSQGQTYSAAIINPASFAAGQLYVALSRLCSIDGLTLTRRITSGDIRVSAAVQQFYHDLAEKKHRGRPAIEDKRKVKGVIMWVPAPLEKHVREEVQKGRALKLSRLPAYSSDRVHIRIPNLLADHVTAEIKEWRTQTKHKNK